MAKHASIYPGPEELEAVQTLVSTVEGALKKVSDWMDSLKEPSGKTSEDAGDNMVEKHPEEPKYVLVFVLLFQARLLALVSFLWLKVIVLCAVMFNQKYIAHFLFPQLQLFLHLRADRFLHKLCVDSH